MTCFANYFSELYFGRFNYVGVSFFRGKHSLKNSVLLGYSRVLLSRQIPKTQRYIPGDLNLQQHHSADLIFPKYHANCESVNQQAITFFTAPQKTRYRQFMRLVTVMTYTGCNRRKGPDFGRVFLRSNYTDITQNTYIQS